MKVIGSFFCAFLILSVSLAVNNPMRRDVIFFLVGFILWMVLSYRIDKLINVPQFVIPLSIYVIFLLVLYMYKHDNPYVYHWTGVSIIFVLLIILFSDVLKTWHLQEIVENALIILSIYACIFNLVEIFNWYHKWLNLNGQVFVLPLKGIRISGFFLGAPNSFAGSLNIIWPIVLLRLFLLISDGRSYYGGDC